MTQGIAKLVAPWDECLKRGEDCVEKQRDSHTNKSDRFFFSEVEVMYPNTCI